MMCARAIDQPLATRAKALVGPVIRANRQKSLTMNFWTFLLSPVHTARSCWYGCQLFFFFLVFFAPFPQNGVR